MRVRSEEGQRRERERKRQYEQRRVRADRDRSRRRYSADRACSNCQERYAPENAEQRHCSRQCSNPKQLPWPSCKVYFPECAVCGKRYTARTSRGRTCSKDCGYQDNKQQTLDRYRTDPDFRDYVLANTHARRAEKLGLESKKVLISYLNKRDRGRCGICHRLVRDKQGPMRPSIDHIIPLSRGGTHELTNVQLAHYRCNLEKHNGGSGEQLLLVG